MRRKKNCLFPAGIMFSTQWSLSYLRVWLRKVCLYIELLSQKSQFQISHMRVERRRDVQELLQLVQKENQAKPHEFLLPLCSEVIIDPPETQRVLGCSYSHGFGGKTCKHSRVTSFDCVWHCLGETHGHSTSPQETSVKCNCALNTHTHRVAGEGGADARCWSMERTESAGSELLPGPGLCQRLRGGAGRAMGR